MYGNNTAVLGAATVATTGAAWYLNGWTIALSVASLAIAGRVIYIIVTKKVRP